MQIDGLKLNVIFLFKDIDARNMEVAAWHSFQKLWVELLLRRHQSCHVWAVQLWTQDTCQSARQQGLSFLTIINGCR